MKRIFVLVQILLALSFPSSLFSQTPTTGFPPFGSFDKGSFDAVNRQNLNVNFSIPIVSEAGRGRSFNFAIVYDSLVWRNANGFWAFMNGWKTGAPTGKVTFTQVGERCDVPPPYPPPIQHYFGFVYTDPAGTTHPFNLDYYAHNTCSFSPTGPTSGYATDGSGYFLNGVTLQVTNPQGFAVTGTAWTDANGNYLSAAQPNGNEFDWKDTAGHIVLKIITSATTTQYQVPVSDGTFATYTLKWQNYSVKTSFGCTGITDYSGTQSLPYELDLPNNTKYLFSYEASPSFAGYYTGRLSQVTLPTGGSYQYQYPTSPNNGLTCKDAGASSLTRVANDGSVSTQWQYSRVVYGATGWTTTVTSPLRVGATAQDVSVFSFDTVRENNRQFYNGPVAAGNLMRSVSTSWATNGTPSATSVTLEDGTTRSQVETTYDNYGNLLTMKEHDWGSPTVGPVLRTTNFTYLGTSAYTSRNIVNRVTQVTVSDSSGTVKSRTDIAYDESSYSNVNCITGAVQHDDTNYSCTFLTRGNPTTVTTYTDAATPAGAIVKHHYYDSLGNLVKADLDCCQQEQWSYSAATNYSFPDTVTRGATGTQVSLSATYNQYTGAVATATDENGQVTSYSYDVLSRMVDMMRPDSTHVLYAFDDVNRKIKVTKPVQGSNTLSQTFSLDGLGRIILAQTTDAGATSYSKVETLYDSWGHPYKVSNPHNSTAQYWTESRFDVLGRPTLEIPADGSPTSNNVSYTYSLTTTTRTDPTGKQRKEQIDGLGRIIKVFEPDTANGNSLTQETDYSHSVLDKLLTLTQGSQTRNYTYDDLARLLTAKIPETNQVAFNYQYNTFGLLTQRTDPRGVITTYGYDGLNRLHQVSYNVGTTGVPATATVTLNYGTTSSQNNNGRLISVTDGVGSESYAYNLMGRVSQVQKTIGSTVYTIGYAYNDAGQLLSITYPSGRVVQQTRDSIGRTTAVSGGTTNYVSGISYNFAEQLTGMNYGNGLSATFGYSPDRLQLTCVDYSTTNRSGVCTHDTNTKFGQNYSYGSSAGNNGQLTSVTDSVDSGRNQTLTYDPLYRLADAYTTGSTAYPQWHLSWVYDRYGNRTAQNILAGTGLPSSCITISTATNRVTGTCGGGGGFLYDANGNMTNDGTNTLVYDGESRIASSAGTSGSGSYAYDGNGFRVQKTSGGTTTVFVNSGSQVLAEYPSGAPVTAPTVEYVYLEDSQVAVLSGSTTKYLHADALSTRMRSDSTGAIADERGLFPFGEVWYSTTSPAASPVFTTYYRDNESGNDYATFRNYSNRLGRFLSPDHVTGTVYNPQSQNLFGYVRNDPVNHTDPTGLSSPVPVYYLQYRCLTVGFRDVEMQVGDDSPVMICGYYSVIRGWIWGSDDDDPIQKAVKFVKQILGDKNKCSEFFNSATFPDVFSDDHDIGAGVKKSITDAASAFDFDRVAVPDNPAVLEQMKSVGAGAASKFGSLSWGIAINPDGAFFQSTRANGHPYSVSGFSGGTLGAQLIILLHEFGHQLKLLPADDPKSDPNGQVQKDNATTIEQNCKDVINAVIAAISGKGAKP